MRKNPSPLRKGARVRDAYGNVGVIEEVPQKGHRGAHYWVRFPSGRAFLKRSEIRGVGKRNPLGPARGKNRRQQVLTPGGQYAGEIYQAHADDLYRGSTVRGRGLQSLDRHYLSKDDAERQILEEHRALTRRNPSAKRKRNPLTLPIGYTGDDLPGHAIPWSREGHKRIRAAISRIDRARTHAELFKAYHDAMRVTRSLDAKSLGAGRGYPHEWRNDIGASYTAKYAELGPTEEDVREAAFKAARKREEDARRAKRKGRSR